MTILIKQMIKVLRASSLVIEQHEDEDDDLVVVLVVCVMFSVALLEWFSSSIANGALLLVFCLFVSGSFVFRVWSKPYYFRV